MEEILENSTENLGQNDNRIVYVIVDPDNPMSALNLTSEAPILQDAIKRVMVETPAYLSLDEGSFKEFFNGGITATMSRIRVSFWTEYEFAVMAGRKMYLSRIMGGVCGDTYFKEKFLKDNKKVAYMLTPPSDYVVQTKEALQVGLETIREIISARVIDEDGYLIPRAADVVLKAFMHLDMRVKGAIIQRIDQRTLALNVNQNSSLVSPPIQIPRTIEELDQQLEELKKRINVKELRPESLELADMHDSLEVDKSIVSNGRGSYILTNK